MEDGLEVFFIYCGFGWGCFFLRELELLLFIFFKFRGGILVGFLWELDFWGLYEKLLFLCFFLVLFFLCVLRDEFEWNIGFL